MSNGVMMQFFQWYTPADGGLWRELADSAKSLADQGFTALWLPPAGKGASGPHSVGYDSYDLFDLGEFDQKGAAATKYGTKEQYLAAVRAAQGEGLQVYADVVFNHKDGGDEKELVWVQAVDREDRNRPLGDWFPMHAWTQFNFEKRGGRYSRMRWFWWCFDALSYNADTGDQNTIFRLKDKTFSTEVSPEHGNYDYLMANDLDTGAEFVQGELRYWGEWFLEMTGVDGFRLDACKHIRAGFFREWLGHLRGKYGRELFTVGEYWSNDVNDLNRYLASVGGSMSLFDVPLHDRFYRASRMNGDFDMRTLLDNTLVQSNPLKAVTFVDNHDTQPCQALQSPVEDWFKPLAYALILLRREGYPCVFYADYHGTQYYEQHNDRCFEANITMGRHRWLIDKFLWARKAYGYGDQRDYFDHWDTVGWTRFGDAAHPGAMAVLMSDGWFEGSKWMDAGRPNAWFHDHTGHIPDRIQANADGWANFRCPARSVSVWLQE